MGNVCCSDDRPASARTKTVEIEHEPQKVGDSLTAEDDLKVAALVSREDARSASLLPRLAGSWSRKEDGMRLGVIKHGHDTEMHWLPIFKSPPTRIFQDDAGDSQIVKMDLSGKHYFGKVSLEQPVSITWDEDGEVWEMCN
eukprot:TRINITY_DN79070_c0_g1_i1.p1 TRINITY_DN79070_c0_g1~~TRINITY_DN79070_c0_g1_i1.p1  ORF type:complete len:141 (-),score=25.11 TRINITY_DN79070_c0_g1_i1:131-553(-)